MTSQQYSHHHQLVQSAFTGLFVLVSGKLLPPEPIMCFDCQGSELAQGAVAMLQWKTSLLLSCRPEGCWDEEPTALRLNQFMEEDYVYEQAPVGWLFILCWEKITQFQITVLLHYCCHQLHHTHVMLLWRLTLLFFFNMLICFLRSMLKIY